MTSLDQNVSILFRSNIFSKIFKIILHKIAQLYTKIYYNSKYLSVLTNQTIFEAKCADTPKPKNTPGREQNVLSYPQVVYYY